jgi:hypothetical protein
MQAASLRSAIGCLGHWFYRELASQITGTVEKYHKTIFNSLHRIAVREKIHPTFGERRKDPGVWTRGEQSRAGVHPGPRH